MRTSRVSSLWSSLIPQSQHTLMNIELLPVSLAHGCEMMYDEIMEPKKQVITLDTLKGVSRRSVLRINPGDIITPAARDVLAEMQIKIEVHNVRTTHPTETLQSDRNAIIRLVRDKLGGLIDNSIILKESEKVLSFLEEMRYREKTTEGFPALEKMNSSNQGSVEKNQRDIRHVIVSALGEVRGNLPALISMLLERQGCHILTLNQYKVANQQLIVIVVSLFEHMLTIGKLKQLCHDATRSLHLSFAVVSVHETSEGEEN